MASRFDHIKSPLENVIHIFPQSDGKALRQAFYNTVSLVFVALVFAASVAVYFILEAFLRPLMWAALIGTCIHPFKFKLTESVRRWLKSMDHSGKPLFIGAVTIPIQLLDSGAEFTTQKIIKYAKLLLFIFVALPLSYVLYYYGPLKKIFHLFHLLLMFLSKTLGMFSTLWFASVIIGYVLLVIFYWTPHSSVWLKQLSLPVWIITIAHLAAISGPLKVPLFLFFVVMMMIGLVTYAKENNQPILSVYHLGELWEFITRPRGRSESLASAVPTDEEDTEGDLQEDPVDVLDGEGDTGAPVGTPTGTTNFNRRASIETVELATISYPDVAEVTVAPTFPVTPGSPRLSRPSSISLREETGSQRPGVETEGRSEMEGLQEETEKTEWMTWTRFWNLITFSRQRTSSTSSDPKVLWSPSSRRPRSSSALGTPSSVCSEPLVHSSMVRRAFIVLLWCHILVYMWSRVWLVHLVPVAMLLVGLKKTVGGLANLEVTRWLMTRIQDAMERGLHDRIEALAPIPVRGLFNLLIRGDKKIRQVLDSSLDSFVSIFVILMVIFGTLFITIFLSFQIHSESIHLVTMTSSVLNDTMHSEMANWLPEREYLKTMFDTMMANAYLFGRNWIVQKIDQLFDTNPYNKAKIEEQALELWEKLYQKIIYKYNETNATDSLTHPGAPLQRQSSLSSLPLSLTNLYDTLTSIELLDIHQVITFVKENLGILSTVLESVWVLLKSNINLCFSLFTAIFSIVLGGGTAVLNFIVSSLIFLTTLFYLLAFSGESYLPVQFVTSLTPAAETNPTIKRFYRAVESAISSVFEATIKMAVFYGFYTVLTHTLFGVNLVVIPAVLAAVFGSIPFLGTYWAAVPGVLELILVHNELGLAIVLFVIHLLPTYLLDTAIYSEIKGAGHPYMTGLAIAGGIYCMGLEGAIVGPILLCFLLVAVNVYSTMLSPTQGSPVTGGPTTDSKARRFSGRKVQFNPLSRKGYTP